MLVDFALLTRLVLRCAEIAGEPGMAASVMLVHQQLVAGPANAYTSACRRVASATTARTQAHGSTERALAAFDKPYAEARALAATFVEGVLLPETLGSASTDTDKQSAIDGMLSLLVEHAGEAWVGAVNAGPFAAGAPQAQQALAALIAADKALTEAETARSEAFLPAYKAVIKMKRVVRAALGRTSPQHRRLRIPRSRAAKAAQAAEDQAKPAAVPPKPSSPDGTGTAAAPPAADKPADPSAPK